MIRSILAASMVLATGVTLAAPANYEIDASHTYPSFEADHKGGLSLWRGKINKSSGKVVYDKEGKAGSVDITMDVASIDFGHDKMNEHAVGPQIFDTAKFPTATYKGKLANFKGDAPTEVDGELTLHGVTKPVKLTVNSFVCKVDGMTKKEVCGADASGNFNRADFVVNFGQQFGFKMDVKILVTVEAVKAE